MLQMPEFIKNQPATIGSAFTIAAFIIGAAVWASVNFVTRVEAEQTEKTLTLLVATSSKTLTQLVATNSKAISGLATEFRFGNAMAMADTADRKLYFHIRDEKSSGGETDQSVERRYELQKSKAKAEKYLNCLVNKRDNCALLKPTGI